MTRTENVFAIASATLLVLGFILSNYFQPRYGMTLTWPGAKSGHMYMFGYNVPCYGIAGLFAVFACSYAVGWIPLSRAVSIWHVCPSLSGAALFGLAVALFTYVTAQDMRTPSQPTLWTIAVGLLGGPIILLAGQIIFAIAAVRTLAAHQLQT